MKQCQLNPIHHILTYDYTFGRIRGKGYYKIVSKNEKDPQIRVFFRSKSVQNVYN